MEDGVEISSPNSAVLFVQMDISSIYGGAGEGRRWLWKGFRLSISSWNYSTVGTDAVRRSLTFVLHTTFHHNPIMDALICCSSPPFTITPSIHPRIRCNSCHIRYVDVVLTIPKGSASAYGSAHTPPQLPPPVPTTLPLPTSVDPPLPVLLPASTGQGRLRIHRRQTLCILTNPLRRSIGYIKKECLKAEKMIR